MWKRPDKPVPIHPSQLVIGLYIHIDLDWSDHPFLYNKFRITDAAQIAQIQALGLTTLNYFPNKSQTEPGPVQARPAVPEARPAQPELTAEAVALAEKRKKLQAQKDAAARAERGWERAAKQTREALVGLHRSPKQAGQALSALSRDTAEKIAADGEVLLHLLGDKQGDGPQFHALNVMTLSMVLGKALGLGEDELADLALAALAHDAGKARVPAHILKAPQRARHEEDFYRAHVQYGVEMAQESGVFSAAALAGIRDHHEYLDGSGFPAHHGNASTIARIVALINRYDRLCCPESPERPGLMPTEALSALYVRELRRFDERMLGLLIKTLGVYPPGTIVQLDDGSLGLVVSPGAESLRPDVLIYDPDVAKTDAIVVRLGDAPSLNIEEALRPSALPPDVLDWLNPRQRLSYFFSVSPRAA